MAHEGVVTIDFDFVIVDIILGGNCNGQTVRTILSKRCIIQNRDTNQVSTVLFAPEMPDSPIDLDKVILEDLPIPESWIEYNCQIKIVCGTKSDAIQLLFTPTEVDNLLGKYAQQKNHEELSLSSKSDEYESVLMSPSETRLENSSSIEINDFEIMNSSGEAS